MWTGYRGWMATDLLQCGSRVLCRFSAAGNDETIRVLGRPAAEKRQGRKSRWVGH